MKTHTLLGMIIVSFILFLIFNFQMDLWRKDFRMLSVKQFLTEVDDITSPTVEYRVPKIIAWTGYFKNSLVDRIRWLPCPFHCEVYNRPELQADEADVIVFHFRNLLDKIPFPKTRRPDQIYVSFLKEAPVHTGGAINNLKFTQNFFNATVDYRRSNTYFDQSYFTPVIDEEDKKKMKPLSEDDFDEIYDYKTKDVLVIISNCRAESGRLAYIRELSKYVNVTRVGGCFGRRISGSKEAALMKSHHFVIAFENILCKDYVTEKFWRIDYDIVPIVLRRWVLKEKAPDGAFVAADDFANPREMAEHLRKAIYDRNEYRKYFEFRNTHYKVTVDGFCNLCRDAHFKNVSSSSNLDMKEYYSFDRECEFGTAKKLLNNTSKQ